MSIVYRKYALLSDRDIVDQILSGNEEAALYLLYDKFAKDIQYFAWKYFETLDVVDELTTDLYLELRGQNLDWAKLRSFEFKSSLRTWFSVVATNLFSKKRKKMIDEDNKKSTIDIKRYIGMSAKEVSDPRIPIMLEAISKIKNEEFRLIIIKDLEGYSHKDIALMITEKRKREGKQKTYGGKEVVYDAYAVDRDKARAIKEIKKIMEELKSK